ncbi:hypothetical protein ACFY1S_03010 [Micromonospora sp. NPDC000663]|uniref:hypothetical protein n=1 Tax=Micromonospora sp. NPDC000663 TaxID=3364218 RepID=UPI00369052BB
MEHRPGRRVGLGDVGDQPLVNNAGIVLADGAAGLPSETTLATLRRVYETN